MPICHLGKYVRSYEKHLIEANRGYWKNVPDMDQNGKWIYVFHCLSCEFGFCVHEDLVAKGLQNREKLPVISVTYEMDTARSDALDTSFGIKKILRLGHGSYKNIFAKVKTYVKAQYLSIITYKNPKKLFRLQYRKIPFGDALHGAIVRENDDARFSCFNVDRKTYFNYIWDALLLIDQSFAILGKRRPAFIVTTEPIYLKGLFGEVAGLLGGQMLILSQEYPHIIMRMLPEKHIRYGLVWGRMVENYIKEHGIINSEAKNLFLRKSEEHPQDNLLEQLGIRNHRKNIFIMLHVLNDLPRGYQQYIYDGYNEWFLDTLRIIKNVPDVNWIIKDHPWASFVKQDVYVRSLFEENKAENIYWCDKNVSGMQIKEIADCVVTCAGEVALEYWAYGIPTITTADAYFCKWGVSYCMKSLEEYERTLCHIKDLPPPTKESSQKARSFLEAMNQMGKCDDSLAQIIQTARREQMADFRRGVFYTPSAICHFCEAYTRLLEKEELTSSIIYQLTNVYDI